MSSLIAVCFHRFGPYHVARLIAAAEKMNIVGIEFASNTREYEWDLVDTGQTFRRVVVFPEGDIRTLPRAEQRRHVWRVMDDLRPDVVAVNGWSTSEALTTLSWAAERRVPVVMMSESTAWDFTREGLKEWVKQHLLQRALAGLVGGCAHTAYLVQLGMSESRIFSGYDVVDNDYFANSTNSLRLKKRPNYLPNSAYFLASNRFIPKKNLERLIDAFAAYRSIIGAVGWELVLLGDGYLRPELERQVRRLHLESVVHFPGFRQYDVLPNFYAWASAFIHASTTEQWGLVVNEAMASGLPVLVSERCGCATELVHNSQNGYTFDPYEVNALAKLMLKISSDDCDRTAMGRASREIINRWSPETFADGLAQAVDVALNTPLPKVGWMDNALLWALSHR